VLDQIDNSPLKKTARFERRPGSSTLNKEDLSVVIAEIEQIVAKEDEERAVKVEDVKPLEINQIERFIKTNVVNTPVGTSAGKLMTKNSPTKGTKSTRVKDAERLS